jgi:hypothetical protein
MISLAFAGTVYGDEVSQIVFTDDINIDNLTDNRGYPLTELYFTVLKANRGHKEWYEENDYDGSNAGKHSSYGTRASDYI